MHVLVLSPHRDDAAFSCGLLAAGLLRKGAQLTVINVCTISDYAPYLPPGEADRAAQVSEERAREDGNFFEALARRSGVGPSSIREIDLQWSDAPLRLDLATDAVLRHGLNQSEVDALAGAFAALPEADVVLAPLALGGHLDHRMVRDAALLAFADTLSFYEDLPYAARMSPEQRAWEIAAARGMHSWASSHFEEPGTKRAFAMHYPSQIAAEVAEEMEQYTFENGGRENFYVCESVKRSLDCFEGNAR